MDNVKVSAQNWEEYRNHIEMRIRQNQIMLMSDMKTLEFVTEQLKKATKAEKKK